MGFRINTNVASLTAQTSAAVNNRNLDSSLAKLSSGLRINKAADDASGLAIANSLRAQASSLGQAVSNGNDAIGLIQTADGALSEYSNILDTIKTKSVQAASDGQNSTSRLAIQKDISRLLENLNNIAKTTSFNGQKLLSGTFTNKEFQVGANANETIKTSIASAETSQIGQTSRATLTATAGENQLTLKSAISGASISLESVNLQMNNNPANGMGALADLINKHSAETGITAKAVVSTTTASAISAGTTGNDFAINGVNIGAINVTANDSQSTLLTAINNKTTETGVTATKTADGKITLATSDGRAISVTGDVAGVMGSNADQMSTIGHLEVVQAGSSTFQIKGAELGTAVGANITISSAMNTVEDSTLSIGSTIASGSTIAAGTKLGVTISASVAMTANALAQDALLTVGSIIASGSTVNKDTVLGGKLTVDTTTVLSSDMLVKAGSTLATGTKFDAGTIINQDMTISGTNYKAGSVLLVDTTIGASESVTLSKDMVMHVDITAPNAAIGDASILNVGSVLGQDIVASGGGMTVVQDMTLKAGSSFFTGSEIAVGSVMGEAITVSAATAYVTTAVTDLKAGSILTTGSILKENSTLGGTAGSNADITLNQDMQLKAGTLLKLGSTLKAGTVIQQNLTAAQAGGSVAIAAGTTLTTDLLTTADIYLSKDMTMLKGDTSTGATLGTIKANSVLAPNAGDRNSVQLSDTAFTNLSTIDVTTLEGAMKAIDTVSAAMTNLDTIRSDLGSVQNQITSTINNISVTQVNVKSAESGIRDVDFAAESANFSKFNILAQSGSYAMSQANSVQQNVLKLLQ
ncbi:flagellin [Sulfurospirillum diekertiae]|uniref:Flagellin n=1 Tax=Sulfurospirillum diekertiae TaxID=1854492 RepID=A0A290HI33_9BACT|nr:flagellin [Sulfurospirillum diekertiae]ATB70891.1 flagellin [Sulfurospirillum diekertiae]